MSSLNRFHVRRRWFVRGTSALCLVLAVVVLGRVWSAPPEPTRRQRVLKVVDVFERAGRKGPDVFQRNEAAEYRRSRALAAVRALEREDGPYLVEAYLEADHARRERLCEALTHYTYLKEYVHRFVPLVDSADVELARDALGLLVAVAGTHRFSPTAPPSAREFAGSVLQHAFERADGALREDAVRLARDVPSGNALVVIDRAFRSGGSELRKAAVRALGSYGAFSETVLEFGSDYVPVRDIIREALGSPDEGLVRAALATVEELALEDFTGAVMEVAASPVAALREAAVNALLAIGNDDARKSIRSLLSDSSPDVRAAAARACGIGGDREALDDLRKMLASEVAQDRGTAALELSRLKDDSSVPELEKLLEDPDRRVRLTAWEALRRLTGKDYAVEIGESDGAEGTRQ